MANGQDAVRIVNSQSGRSIRFWKVGSWFTLAMINMSIAESKGRGKFRWGITSLVFGPIATMFLAFSKPCKEDPNTLVPREAAQSYNEEEQSASRSLAKINNNINNKTTNEEITQTSTVPPSLKTEDPKTKA